MKFMSKTAAFMAAILVAACGGGGGGGSTQANTAPAPTASLLSVSPATGATVTANSIDGVPITVKFSVTDALTSDTSKVALSCNNNPVPFKSASSLSADGKTMTVVFSPTAVPALVGQNYQCTLSGDLTVTGPGGTGATHGNTSFGVTSTCTAPTVWTPSINICVTPTLVGATGFYQLPANCTSTTQSCFKDSVPKMSAVAAGSSTTWLAFLNNAGRWGLLPFQTKDGSAVGVTDTTGGYSVELDRFWGNPDGSVTIHQKGISTAVCWNITTAGAETQASCP